MAGVVTLNPIHQSLVRQAFNVSGTYQVTPAFQYADDGGAFFNFPAGSVEPTTGVENWSFLHSGYAVSGTHAIQIEDTLTSASVSGHATAVSGSAHKTQSVLIIFEGFPF